MIQMFLLFAPICANKEINTNQTQIDTKDFTNNQNNSNIIVKLKFYSRHFSDWHTNEKNSPMVALYYFQIKVNSKKTFVTYLSQDQQMWGNIKQNKIIAFMMKKNTGKILKFICLLVPYEFSFFVQVVFTPLFEKGMKGKIKTTESCLLNNVLWPASIFPLCLETFHFFFPYKINWPTQCGSNFVLCNTYLFCVQCFLWQNKTY